MNLQELSDLAQEKSWVAYGKHAAYSRCVHDIREMRAEEIFEIKKAMEESPEPSDMERADWKDATRQYVEALELIVDDILEEEKS